MNDKYLTRFDFSGNHGWQVRMGEISNGHFLPGSKDINNKMFADSLFNNSHAAAIRWRNKYLKTNDAMHMLTEHVRLGEARTNSGNNTSGAIGITRSIDVLAHGDISQGYKGTYSATVKGKRRQLTKQFGDAIYGECGAFKWACKYRYDNLGEPIVITNRLAIPCYPDVPYILKEQLCA